MLQMQFVSTTKKENNVFIGYPESSEIHLCPTSWKKNAEIFNYWATVVNFSVQNCLPHLKIEISLHNGR